MTKVIELANTDVEAYYKCSPCLQERRRTNKPDEENGRQKEDPRQIIDIENTS